MTHFKPTLTLALLAVLTFGFQQSGSAFQDSARDGADLGPAAEDLPPLPKPNFAPPKPGGQADDEKSADEKPAPKKTEYTAADHAAAAGRMMRDGRYDLAIQALSLAVAAEPKNADYRTLRAQAYQLSGRYEEALADTNPLVVVAGVRDTKLKSANDVIAVVPKGAVLQVTEVKGNWLRVAATGDQKFEWAWVYKGSLVQGRRPPQPLPNRIVINPVLPAEVYGRYYGGGYYELGRRSGFGRAYYDWTGHVPRRYWGYLPW
jgi:tetratricopeptide (TPR) repeat protein